MNTSYFLTTDSLPAAQYLVLPTHNTPRPRSFTLHPQTIKLPRHQRRPSSTTPNISRLLRYHPTSHITKQNRRQAPFASQRLHERHPSSTLTTSHLSQKGVTYPNDEQVRNTATRRAIDKDKRHVPCCFRVHNGELISMTLQPCRLRSAMWHLHSQPCVRWGNDLSLMPTSYNMRHSLTNKLPQVISNSNAPCSGSKSSFAILVYFPDSVPFLTSVSFFYFISTSLFLLYMCLCVSLRYDESTLISIMQFPASSSFLPMFFIYAFKIISFFNSFCLRFFNLRYEKSISYFRLMSKRHNKYLSICWSLCLNTKFPFNDFNSKSFQVKDFDSKFRIK